MNAVALAPLVTTQMFHNLMTQVSMTAVVRCKLSEGLGHSDFSSGNQVGSLEINE